MANKVHGFNLPEELLAQYQRIAAASNLSLSKVVSIALDAQLGSENSVNMFKMILNSAYGRLCVVHKKKYWYAFQRDPSDGWDDGTFSHYEAVKRLINDENVQLVAVIDGDVCVREIHKEDVANV